MQYFLIYLIVINIISFFLCLIDKLLAIKQMWRIKEKTLLLFCFLGGCFLFLISMYLFNHKIKKKSFFTFVLISVIIWTLFLFLWGNDYEK